jgi:copper chaperone CopZ
MSRRHARTPSTAQRPSAIAPPASARIESGARERDVLFSLEIDSLLAQRAADRRSALEGAPSPAAPPVRVITTTIPVAGMTCRTCENRIARYVGRIPDVQQVTASAVRGRVEITSAAPIPPAVIAKAVRAAGYEIGRTPWLTPDPDVWMTAIVGIVLVGGLALLASVTGLAGLASGVGDLSQGGIVIALLLGLAAGVST